MDQLIVASVQQRIRVFATLDNYRNELQRFLRVAQHKHAALVVFPELGATMLVPPLLRDPRVTLLKYAELGRRRKAPLWQRYSSGLSWWLASQLSTTFVETVADCLAITDGALWQTYCDFFGDLAKQNQLTIVAPSGYLPDPSDGAIRNLTGLFAPDGSLLGYQAKVMLHEQDKALAEPGRDWEVIQTDVGAIGLLLGNDMLYPEISRLLRYKGAEILVGQGACATTVLYQKLRAGLLDRMQDNQLFAAASFLVGQNDMSGKEKLQYVGRSAIFAPQELTARFNGILVEMGNPRSEGVLSADWNYSELQRLWDLSDTPLSKDISGKQAGWIIASLHARLQHATELLDDNSIDQMLTNSKHLSVDNQRIMRLDELPVLTTITRRWPPIKVDYSMVDSSTAEIPALAHPPSKATHTKATHTKATHTKATHTKATRSDIERSLHATTNAHSTAEDETEEMDALPGSRTDAQVD